MVNRRCRRELGRCATFAANKHNTQPWMLESKVPPFENDRQHIWESAVAVPNNPISNWIIPSRYRTSRGMVAWR